MFIQSFSITVSPAESPDSLRYMYQPLRDEEDSERSQSQAIEEEEQEANLSNYDLKM